MGGYGCVGIFLEGVGLFLGVDCWLYFLFGLSLFMCRLVFGEMGDCGVYWGLWLFGDFFCMGGFGGGFFGKGWFVVLCVLRFCLGGLCVGLLWGGGGC